jgi:hypothetical protein
MGWDPGAPFDIILTVCEITPGDLTPSENQSLLQCNPFEISLVLIFHET